MKANLNDRMTPHPKGTNARILLTSVFGPYAQDDEYGSRVNNPMELYHNQVTREQGIFSLRMFHRSFGLLLMQKNVTAPCTVLDFPTLDRFIDEIRANDYDVIGISAIIPNIDKVIKMVSLIRSIRPRATIVVGGHISAAPDIQERVGADHVVRGDGVRWLREFVGNSPDAPIKQPHIYSGFGARTFGGLLSSKAGDTAAILVPSVGCPIGCNFCSTSAMFGGKGKFINFYETGEKLFEVMSEISDDLKTRSFFVLDENFLLHRPRAMRLLELMKKHNKSWSLYVFSSANALKLYTMEELVELGISWVWVGVEGASSDYHKLDNSDTISLVTQLQENGIRVLASSIIGLETHTPENISNVIDHAVAHNSVFHQFMLYTAVPGTPLYEEVKANGTLIPTSELTEADTHGQTRFNVRHKQIPAGIESDYLLEAFRRDFSINGPSIIRFFHVTLQGWKKYQNHPDLRVRKRFADDIRGLSTSYTAGAWAAREWFKKSPSVYKLIDATLQDLYREFGVTARLSAALLGPIAFRRLQKENERLQNGWTYEPPCFCEDNEAAAQLRKRTLERSQSPVNSRNFAPINTPR